MLIESRASDSPISAVSIWHQHGATTSLLSAPLIDVRTGNGFGCMTAEPGSLVISLTGSAEPCGIGVVLHYDTVTTVARRADPHR